MKKMILVLMMVAASAMVTNCSNCNPCAGSPVPSDCSGTNSYTGNWY